MIMPPGHSLKTLKDSMMIRCGALAYLCLLLAINSVKSAVLVDLESANEFNDENVSEIMGKLIEIEEKVHAIDNKLKHVTNTETISIDRMISQSIKEIEMQRSLDKLTQKVEDISSMQMEMKTQVSILSKRFEDHFNSQRDIPNEQSKNFIGNTTTLESLISSNQDRNAIEIASLEKHVIGIESLVRELNDSQKKLKTNLEDHISNENQKLMETMKRKKDAHDNVTILQRNVIDESFERKELPILEKHFRIINASLMENRKNLLINQLEIKQGFKEHTARYGDLVKIMKHDMSNSLSKYMQEPNSSLFSFEHIKKKHDDINSSMVMLNSNVAAITDFLKAGIFEDCIAAIKNSGLNGIYKIFIPQSGFSPFEADCRTDSQNGNGWTVIQRRIDGKVDFHRGWQDYKQGFGDPKTGEFWIGLEKIYAITSKKPHELYIEMGDFNGTKRYARYSHFEIGSEKEKFYLKSVGDFSGDAGDSLGKANITRKFTTKDVDNDIDSSRNCAATYLGAWWYNTCNWSDLNGQYNNTRNGKGVNWYSWLGYEYSLKYTFMAIHIKG